MKYKFIGVGSPQYDDQIGWKIIDELRERKKKLLPAIELIKLDRPGMRLIEFFNEADEVIIFDAAIGIKAGEVKKLSCVDELADSLQLLSSHGFGVIEAIKMATVLNRLPAKLTVYAIGVGEPSLVWKNALKLCDDIFTA